MKTFYSNTLFMAVASVILGIPTVCLAGKPQKWESLPKAVQKTILDNGGKEGMTVDLEPKKNNGKSVYEAGIKGADGKVKDLVILEDGKLVETKTDDEADKADERKLRAEKLLKGVSFSHSREITNPYLPLSSVKQDILEGMEDGKKIRVERTAKPDVRKTYKVGALTIEALAFEDRVFEDGKLAEVVMDFFAQDDEGNVYYLGEDVDEYKDGKIVAHDGSWHFGKDTPVPGLMFPAQPKLGQKWRSEDVSDEISEMDEIISMSEKVTTPAGTFENCIKVKEVLADGKIEYKYYARGAGVVREVPEDGDLLIKSQTKVGK